MDIFIICTVRGAKPEYVKELEDYAAELESKGHNVHLPHRDTDQNARGIDICKQNAAAILNAHEVHIFYNEFSQGTHFDMGVSFAYAKRIKVIKNADIIPAGKSYPRMLMEWESNSNSKWHWQYFDFLPNVAKEKAMELENYYKK